MKLLQKFFQLLFALLLFLSSCSSETKYDRAGWHVVPDEGLSTLTVSHDSLGVVLRDVSLMVMNEGGALTPVTGWKAETEKGNLMLRVPDNTTWIIRADTNTLLIYCAEPGAKAFVRAEAPAPASRIPARVREQDNGVMYTAYGLVTVRGVNRLFDRSTDIMIVFPESASLNRDDNDASLLNVTFPVGGEPDEQNMAHGEPSVSLTPFYYDKVVGLTKHQKTSFVPKYRSIPDRFDRAPTGWSSWYCYYMTTTEADMVKETDALARLLKPYGLEYVQLDACYTRGEEANWLEWNKEAFPHGGKWLFQYILDKGLKPGLWLNAYGDNYAKPSMAEKYPEDFFLRDKKGNLSGACCTADRTVVRLDYTNPAVMEKHLRPLFDTLVHSWGLKYLKAGGWGTWMDYYEKNRSQAYDSTLDSREAYRSVLENIREIMGDDNYLLGCAMHEVGCGFGLFDGSRTGGDDLAQWYPSEETRMSMHTFFNSLFGANYLNGICWWSDPDNVMLRPPLTYDEARTIATTISLSGQAYISSDFMDTPPPRDRFRRPIHQRIANALPAERLELYRKTMPTRPIHAMDLYPYRCEPVVMPQPASFPRILDLKVNAAAGAYDVAALYNWEDEKGEKSISLVDDLGLDPARRYLVYDYWEKAFLGIVRDTLTLGVPAHGVRALVIHPLEDKPVVLATSRHLTGTVSLKEVQWDGTKHQLTGRSEIVQGDPYTLYLYVPEGMTVSSARVMSGGKAKVNITATPVEEGGSFVAVTIEDEETSLVWQVDVNRQ